MIIFFNLELLQDKIIISIAKKKLVLESSYDLNLNLYLGIAPRARNMLRDISFAALISCDIIFEQRVSSSMSPPLTEEEPLFVFSLPTTLNA